MPIRIIEVAAAPGHGEAIAAIAARFEAIGFRAEPAASPDGLDLFRIVARPEGQQDLTDQLQGALGSGTSWRIVIIPVEATIPELEEPERALTSPEQATREALYAEIAGGARIDATFLVLVLLSTVVAVIGLFESSVTIVIAAMLIAPLLGPNIAMAFGSTLGDRELVARAAAANAVGIVLSVACAAVAGVAFPMDGASAELMARTRLSYDSIILALASGAAGALSLTTRLPGTLVGVMVAVALLPPAATLGYMLGSLHLAEAGGAAALLAVNIVCVNLSAQLIFLSKGIKPRRWIERRAAQESRNISLAVAVGLLAILVGVIYWRQQ